MQESKLSNLVQVDRDAGRFRVSRQAFVDPAVFEAERAQIFDRCWLYVGTPRSCRRRARSSPGRSAGAT
jgi:hypothetical protein